MAEAVTDDLIIVPVAGDTIDTRVAHRPADELEQAPLEAVARCGVTGYVYNRGGELAGLPICEECAKVEASVSCDPRTGSLIDRYNQGCRCSACRAAMSVYRRRYYRTVDRQKRLRPCPDCGDTLIWERSSRCKACHNRARIRKTDVCGTPQQYWRGCRCTMCREANRLYQRAHVARRKVAA